MASIEKTHLQNLELFLKDPEAYEAMCIERITKTVCIDLSVFTFPDKPELNLFDTAVLEAVLANLIAGNKTMTSRMIFYALTGKKRDKPDHKLCVEIHESMKKCRQIRVIVPIKADCGRPMTGTVEGPLLPHAHSYVTAGNSYYNLYTMMA